MARDAVVDTNTLLSCHQKDESDGAPYENLNVTHNVKMEPLSDSTSDSPGTSSFYSHNESVVQEQYGRIYNVLCSMGAISTESVSLICHNNSSATSNENETKFDLSSVKTEPSEEEPCCSSSSSYEVNNTVFFGTISQIVQHLYEAANFPGNIQEKAMYQLISFYLSMLEQTPTQPHNLVSEMQEAIQKIISTKIAKMFCSLDASASYVETHERLSRNTMDNNETSVQIQLDLSRAVKPEFQNTLSTSETSSEYNEQIKMALHQEINKMRICLKATSILVKQLEDKYEELGRIIYTLDSAAVKFETAETILREAVERVSRNVARNGVTNFDASNGEARQTTIFDLLDVKPEERPQEDVSSEDCVRETYSITSTGSVEPTNFDAPELKAPTENAKDVDGLLGNLVVGETSLSQCVEETCLSQASSSSTRKAGSGLSILSGETRDLTHHPDLSPEALLRAEPILPESGARGTWSSSEISAESSGQTTDFEHPEVEREPSEALQDVSSQSLVDDTSGSLTGPIQKRRSARLAALHEARRQAPAVYGNNAPVEASSRYSNRRRQGASSKTTSTRVARVTSRGTKKTAQPKKSTVTNKKSSVGNTCDAKASTSVTVITCNSVRSRQSSSRKRRAKDAEVSVPKKRAVCRRTSAASIPSTSSISVVQVAQTRISNSTSSSRGRGKLTRKATKSDSSHITDSRDDASFRRIMTRPARGRVLPVI